MSIRFRNPPTGAAPGGGEYHPHQVWRSSSGARGRSAPAIWTVLAALLIVALLTAGLHVLFR